MDYLSGVTATDSNGNDLTDKIECDDSKVDLSLAGEYEITYTVTDENGFTAKQTAKVTVADGKTSKKDTKSATTKSETTKAETGSTNSSATNTGSSNTGNSNSGTSESSNSGNSNSGTSGSSNSGNSNSGTSGSSNSGNSNSGTSGGSNSGSNNTGSSENGSTTPSGDSGSDRTLEAPHQVQTLEATTVEIQVQMERCQFQMILSQEIRHLEITPGLAEMGGKFHDHI